MRRDAWIAASPLIPLRVRKHMTRARRLARISLALLTRDIGARYAQEQNASANSGTDYINRHHRQA